MKRRLVNARLVLSDQVIDNGSLLLDDGVICAIDPKDADVPEFDCGGRLVLPGLIDLHCDALEKEVEPRPKVAFAHDFALINSDRRNLTCGITTVYHSISFAGGEWGVRDPRVAGDVVRAVRACRGLINHRVHARYEVTDAGGEEEVARLLHDGDAELVSFMDHSPGQGQFASMDAYVAYMVRTYHTSEADAVRFGASKVEARLAAPERMARLATLARQRGVALASHDDDTADKVAAMAKLGVTISEFPIGIEAARAAIAHGMVTLFGAPNVVRGRSTGGNIRALDAILAGACTGLCADYHPPSLLASVLMLPAISPLSLPEAVRLASEAPARAAGLHDRGVIAVGRRADLIVVDTASGPPQVVAALVNGRVVLDTMDHQANRSATCAAATE